MTSDHPRHGLQLRSLVKPCGQLELSLVSSVVREPEPDEVVVRVEATPLNPSDLGLLLGGADINTARVSGAGAASVLTADIPEQAMKGMAGRLDQSMPVGNEGAGVVVAAGTSDAAQALLGKTVAVLGGAMYSQYRCVKLEACLVLPEGTTPAEGASCFVNPLTALGMVETMHREGHTALVHTAAASNLGQMLARLCIRDRIGLVNIVRKPEQEDMLRSIGAAHVCNANSPTFMEDLTRALVVTGATLAFDATGGGPLAGQILTCMEAALNRHAEDYSRYGSSTHKHVYLYGALDAGPTEISRSFGMAWGIGGWLLFPGAAAMHASRQRIAAELKTTFASAYSKVISLAEALQPDAIQVYAQRATGQKYLINPNLDLAVPPSG